MKIKLKCECGKVLAAPEKAAGKFAKCPGCGRKIKVPTRSTWKPPPKPATVCPECNTKNPPGALECENCGLNFETGKHFALETEEEEKKPRGGLAKIILPITAFALVVLAAALFIFLRKPAELETLDLIPQSASVVGSMDMRRIRNIPAFKKALAQDASKEKGAIMKGFDLEGANTSRLYLAATQPKKAGAASDTLIIFETLTPVEEKNVIAKLREENKIGQPTQIAGKAAYPMEMPGPKIGPRPELMIIFLRDNLMAVGSYDMIEKSALLAAGKSTASIKKNRQLMKLCEQANRNDMVWMAGIPTGALPGQLGQMGPGAAMNSGALKNFTLSCNYEQTAGLSLNVVVECKSEQNAGETAQKLQAAVGVLALFGLGQDALKIQNQGKNLLIAAVLSPDELDALMEKATQAPAMPMMPPTIPPMKEGQESPPFTFEEGQDSELLKELMKKAGEAQQEEKKGKIGETE